MPDLSIVQAKSAYDPSIGGEELRMLIYLGAHADRRTGTCCISINRLCRDSGKDRRNLNRAIRNLITAGYIERDEGVRANGSQAANTYRFLGLKPAKSRVKEDAPPASSMTQTEEPLYMRTLKKGQAEPLNGSLGDDGAEDMQTPAAPVALKDDFSAALARCEALRIGEALKSWCTALDIALNPYHERIRWLDYLRAHPSKIDPKADPASLFKGWCERASELRKAARKSGPAPGPESATSTAKPADGPKLKGIQQRDLQAMVAEASDRRANVLNVLGRTMARVGEARFSAMLTGADIRLHGARLVIETGNKWAALNMGERIGADLMAAAQAELGNGVSVQYVHTGEGEA